MRLLLGFSAVVDAINEKIGVVCNWLVLLACIVSAGNAMVRYAYDISSNAWLEVQWYMFAIIVMFGSGWFMVQASFRKISEHHRDVRQFAARGDGICASCIPRFGEENN